MSVAALPASEEDIARMRDLRAHGWSLSAIAREMGRGRHSVRYWTDPEYQAQKKESERARPRRNKKYVRSPEARARRAELRQARRADPAYREAERERERQRRRERWATDPQFRAKKMADQRRRNKRAAAAVQKMQREQAIRSAVKKAGAAEAEMYVMAERFQDVMGQAHREATDLDKRRHYALAGEYYRKMRDEIVRGLGVT